MNGEPIEFTKGVSFICSTCDTPAKISVDDETLNSNNPKILEVFCPFCSSVSVKGDDARLMHQSLVQRYRLKVARKIRTRLIRKRSKGKVVGKVDDEIHDPRWPFVLVVKNAIG